MPSPGFKIIRALEKQYLRRRSKILGCLSRFYEDVKTLDFLTKTGKLAPYSLRHVWAKKDAVVFIKNSGIYLQNSMFTKKDFYKCFQTLKKVKNLQTWQIFISWRISKKWRKGKNSAFIWYFLAWPSFYGFLSCKVANPTRKCVKKLTWIKLAN